MIFIMSIRYFSSWQEKMLLLTYLVICLFVCLFFTDSRNWYQNNVTVTYLVVIYWQEKLVPVYILFSELYYFYPPSWIQMLQWTAMFSCRFKFAFKINCDFPPSSHRYCSNNWTLISQLMEIFIILEDWGQGNELM